mmetsp:Transcript_19375/g.22222  ORF Transcript_19375/g.22222 Transcript_19375/m.22222 type:complete len:81 (+) Transcript_19375:158-400(+)
MISFRTHFPSTTTTTTTTTPAAAAAASVLKDTVRLRLRSLKSKEASEAILRHPKYMPREYLEMYSVIPQSHDVPHRVGSS